MRFIHFESTTVHASAAVSDDFPLIVKETVSSESCTSASLNTGSESENGDLLSLFCTMAFSSEDSLVAFLFDAKQIRPIVMNPFCPSFSESVHVIFAGRRMSFSCITGDETTHALTVILSKEVLLVSGQPSEKKT